MIVGGSFKQLGNNIVSQHQDGIKIFLESTDDEYIISRHWFSHLKDKISFESVSETKGNGGCQLVLKKVNQSRVVCYGIVDRDILLADPEFQNSLWYEINDDQFTARKPYGPSIFVLHCWEMENYLFHPVALESLVADKTLNFSTTATDIASLLTENENDMIAVTLLSTIPTKAGVTQYSEQYGKGLSGSNLMSQISNELGSSQAKISNEISKINCFAENETDPIIRWHKLSRMLDGKRIMYRIENLLTILNLHSERGALAGHIAKHNLIDSTLAKWLNNIYDGSTP